MHKMVMYEIRKDVNRIRGLRRHNFLTHAIQRTNCIPGAGQLLESHLISYMSGVP